MPRVRRDRLPSREDVLERRHADAIGMRAFARLLELRGSPSSTMLFAACETASTLASDICPLRRRTGRRPPMRARVATRAKRCRRRHWRRPTASVASASSLSSERLDSRRVGRCRRRRHLVRETNGERPSRRPPSATASSRLRMTLWLFAVTPTRFPWRDELADHARAAKRLAGAGRTLDGEHCLVEIAADAHREVDGDFRRSALEQCAA